MVDFSCPVVAVVGDVDGHPLAAQPAGDRVGQRAARPRPPAPASARLLLGRSRAVTRPKRSARVSSRCDGGPAGLGPAGRRPLGDAARDVLRGQPDRGQHLRPVAVLEELLRAARGRAPGRRTRRPAARPPAPSRTPPCRPLSSTVTTSRCPRGEPDQRAGHRQHPARVDDRDRRCPARPAAARPRRPARRTRRRTTSSTAVAGSSAGRRLGAARPPRRPGAPPAPSRSRRPSGSAARSARRRPRPPRAAPRAASPRRAARPSAARARRRGSTCPTCRCATARRRR